MSDTQTTGLYRLVSSQLDRVAADDLFAALEVDPKNLLPTTNAVSRAELAQAMNMLLFRDLLARVPEGAAYCRDVCATGQKIRFDHGALRTVAWASGALPSGEASITRVLRPLGFALADTYPLPRLKMTGRAWRHQDFPESIAQFFVSELHPERFSEKFQAAVTRVLSSSRDPLGSQDVTRLELLARDHALSWLDALLLLPKLLTCFARQHDHFSLLDYETIRAESAEMAWISTEGNAFNHATDRVQDLDALAAALRAQGRDIKDDIEISKSGRVRQTAFRAAQVNRSFLHEGVLTMRSVPGSFYEFIQRAPHPEGGLDLAFDAGNATGIFKMTRVC